jgi:predicted acyl esterase
LTVLDNLPRDFSGKDFLAQHERVLLETVLSFPLTLSGTFTEQLPLDKMDFSKVTGVRFGTVFTHDRSRWTGADYVVLALVERGTRSSFGKIDDELESGWD